MQNHKLIPCVLQRYSHIDKITAALDAHTRLHNHASSSSNNSTNIPRLKVDLSDLRSFDPNLTHALRLDPFRHLRALDAAAHTIANEEREGYHLKFQCKITIALRGPVSNIPSSPRTLNSSMLRQLVCVEGVATKVSSCKPRLVHSVHYCPATRSHEEREYRDGTDVHINLPALDAYGVEQPDRMLGVTSSVYPTSDKAGNDLETEYGLCTYTDYQTLVLQEMPERAPHGQLPRSIKVVLHADLVDKIKPGDRVQVVGAYRALGPGKAQMTSGIFPNAIIANNLQLISEAHAPLRYTPEDVRHIRSLGKRPDVLRLLGNSLAPGIYGHAHIKRALILQMLGGCERQLQESGTRLRGDVNILLLGDPSTAKSQLLRSVMSLAPLAISTTGKGSSGVGLTAAVTTDSDTKERRLEAGAMVLADRGVVLIDEFDKMSESDRVAIHEAMEQQTITIAKAGIYASLNSRCAVLAAANPVYGQYDRNKRIQENIGLPDSLLSRFDLLFVVLDQLDPGQDRNIAEHVLRGHRYRRPGSGMEPDVPSASGSMDDFMGEHEENEEGLQSRSERGQGSIFEKSRNFGNGDRNGSNEDNQDSYKVLKRDFLRKYLHFAKTRMKPMLTEEAREAIAARYAEMRSRQEERTLPVTARSLETVIRLASAHAKARLSNVVEAEPDVAAAMDVLAFALYHEDGGSGRNNEHTKNEDIEISGATRISDTSDDDDDDDSNSNERARKKQKNVTSTEDVQKRIWDALRAAGDGGEVLVADICTDIADEIKMEAIRKMEERVFETDGVLYMV